MKIRLHGTEDECRRVTAVLTAVLQVLDISRPYPGRSSSRLTRIYLTVIPPVSEEKQQ